MSFDFDTIFDGLTISEDGGLEEFEEFLESLATFLASSALTLRSSATFFSKVSLRSFRCLN